MAGRVGSTMQTTPAATCMKILLTVFNFIFWISGVAILALGIWMKVELHVYVELTHYYYENTPYILIGVGAGIILIGSLGCMCTVKGKSALLYIYAVILMLVFVAELGVAISSFYYKGKFQEGFSIGLDEALTQYSTDETKKQAFDGIQQGLACCGKTEYDDWFDVNWSGQGTSDSAVPDSCCKDETADCGKNLNNATLADTIYTEGCYPKVTSFMEKNFIIIGGVAIAFAFLQLLGAILSCCLAKNINKSKYEQVA